MIELHVEPQGAANHATRTLIGIAAERPGMSLNHRTPSAAALNADIEPGPVVDDERRFLGHRRFDHSHVGRQRWPSHERNKCDASRKQSFHDTPRLFRFTDNPMQAALRYLIP